MSIKEDVIKFYRIEHEDTRRSLWYKPNGTYEPFIEKLTEGKAKQLPMDFSTDYYDFGTTWYSALTDVESAHFWFSDLDAFELMKSDYRLYEIVAKNTRLKKHEVMFTKEGIVHKREIPIQEIWDIDKLENNKITIIGG